MIFPSIQAKKKRLLLDNRKFEPIFFQVLWQFLFTHGQGAGGIPPQTPPSARSTP
jgi:hypothetical protein